MPAKPPSSKTQLLPVAKPWLGEEEAAAARRAILSGWVTQGPEVAAFEREFAAFVGAPYACAVSNGTSALQLALLAAGAAPGGEVVTVSHSFIATANAIRACGSTPVFVDIQPGTYNIDPERVEAAVGPKTRAILCVHQLGMPCDLKTLAGLARRLGVFLIEDAACAVGSEVEIEGDWKRIGAPHGDAACFSFHPRKLLTTGDGGMITTRRAEWDAKFRLQRHHGMAVSDTVRHSSRMVVEESYPEPGFNFRLTDIQAATGRVQLGRLPAMLDRRRTLASRYRELLADIPGLLMPEEPSWARSNWQSFCVRLASGARQAGVMQALLDDGISTRRGVMCAHREAAYPPEAWRAAGGLENSEEAQDSGLILPLFHQMTDADQDRVAIALRRACV
ncbi:MAG: DegT/DnrJ/EryC1/StrS family aminotransferase [Elusimicrobia bacterium]|nr:DegT/DnrJ/EryC1/StrS family aminotransferase [Elusimicrobiota bacterium]